MLNRFGIYTCGLLSDHENSRNIHTRQRTYGSISSSSAGQGIIMETIGQRQKKRDQSIGSHTGESARSIPSVASRLASIFTCQEIC